MRLATEPGSHLDLRQGGKRFDRFLSDGRQDDGAMMRIHLKPGQKLSITDADVDARQMMELAAQRTCRWTGQ
jgi:hypothetical protein